MTALTAEQRREIGRRGGQARAKLPDFQDHQSHAGKASATINDMAALGRKGFDACALKYGFDVAFQRARRWRLDHPSWPEQQGIALLDRLGVPYEREAQVLGDHIPLAVDFHITGTRKIVEFNGKVHTHPLFDPDGDRQLRESCRLERLRREGFDVLVIDYRELANVADSRRRILEFIGGQP